MATVVDDSPFHLIGTFPGPVRLEPIPVLTCRVTRLTKVVSTKSYAAQLRLKGSDVSQDINIPESYPFQPVKMKFIT